MAFVVPSIASADVARQCVTPVPVDTTTTATFSMFEVRGEGGQWRTDFTVTVDGSGSIKGGTTSVVGVVDGAPVTEPFTETVLPGGSITLVGTGEPPHGHGRA